MDTDTAIKCGKFPTGEREWGGGLTDLEAEFHTFKLGIFYSERGLRSEVCPSNLGLSRGE